MSYKQNPHMKSVSSLVEFINGNKLAKNKPIYSVDPNANNARRMRPSGPRKPAEGVENLDQGIVSAENTPTGEVILKVTLLAAGFLIGPSGRSIRDIERQTGVLIKSWTLSAAENNGRPQRVFVVEGPTENTVAAVNLMSAAIDRYKELCEGRCKGLRVSWMQDIGGVTFYYQPPPRNAVPFAAALTLNPLGAQEPPKDHQGGMPMGHNAVPLAPIALGGMGGYPACEGLPYDWGLLGHVAQLKAPRSDWPLPHSTYGDWVLTGGASAVENLLK